MKEFRPVYKNDLNAPRMKKGKFSKMVVTKELHKRFIKRYPEHKDMSWDDFFKNWKEIAETIRIETVTNPLGVKLGGYNGDLKYQYLHYKVKVEDHPSSVELGMKVTNPNIITKGRVATLKWERRHAYSYNEMLQFFAFEPTREMTDLAAKYIVENPEKVRTTRSVTGGKGGYNYWRQQRLT